jgi:hypothetical protein
LDTHDTTGAFGVPLHFLLDVRAAVLEAEPSQALVVSDGDSISFDNEPAVWNVLLDAASEVRYVDGAYLWVLPADPTLALFTPAIDDGGWRGFLNAPADKIVTLRPGEGAYRLWRTLPQELPADQTAVQARFANGARLESVARDEDTVWLVWRLPAAQPTQYIVFVHALDAEAQRVSQADLPFLPGDYWREGDRVVVRASLPLAGARSLSIGMYTFVDERTYRNSELLDAEGRYEDQSFTLPLVDIDLMAE